jgi:hypothetical protein
VKSFRQIVFLMLDAFALFQQGPKIKKCAAMKYRRQRISACGTKRQFARCKAMSGVGGKADLPVERQDFSV